MSEGMSDGTMFGVEGDSGACGETPTLDLTRYRARRMRERLLLTVERLFRAIDQRNADRVWAILDDPEAYRFIPANVREEALMLSQQPRSSMRAPVRLYRFQYLLQRLDDEALAEVQEDAQLALDLAPARAPLRVQRTAVRELPFRERRSPDGGPRRDGRDRRRAGSR
jgi:hypothetical protein